MTQAVRRNTAPRRPVRAWRLLTLAVAVVLLAVALGACDRTKRRDGEDDGVTQPIARVNNEAISFEAFQERYHRFLTHWDRFVGNDPEQKQTLRRLVLEQMIDQLLLDQEARRKGIDLDEDEFTARLQALVAPEEGESLTQAVKASGHTVAGWSRSMRRRMVHEKLVRAQVIENIPVTPSEMRAYYERHKEEFKQPEQVKVRHLAVSSHNTFRKVIREVRRGKSFGDLVSEHSITADRTVGGTLGWVERGVLPPEFDEAIFSMRPGQVGPRDKPVQTEMGYHIFKVEDRRKAHQMSFEEARPLIRERIRADKQADAYKEWLQRLRERATIEIDENLLRAGLG